MGSSHEEEGPPPNPIILMIAAIRASLDHKGVSLHRIQHEDTSWVGRKEGTDAELGAIFCHELTSWPQPPKGLSQKRDLWPSPHVVLWWVMSALRVGVLISKGIP